MRVQEMIIGARGDVVEISETRPVSKTKAWAVTRLVEKAKLIAAHQLEASVDDLELAGGRVTVRGTPAAGTTVDATADADGANGGDQLL